MDIHLKAFEDLGAERIQSHGDVVLRAARLRPGKVRLRFPSVGATQNIMMAAAALPGKTTLLNAAREPEMEDLGISWPAWARRSKGRTPRGNHRLAAPAWDAPPGDPGPAGSRNFSAGLRRGGGSLRVKDARPEHLKALLDKMRAAGIKIREERGAVVVTAAKRLKAVSIVTAPHPGFPTDLQPQWMTLMCLARGRSRISEKVFENRFLHAAELARMGARISVSGSDAVVEGVGRLAGAPGHGLRHPGRSGPAHRGLGRRGTLGGLPGLSHRPGPRPYRGQAPRGGRPNPAGPPVTAAVMANSSSDLLARLDARQETRWEFGLERMRSHLQALGNPRRP